jgi:DNA-directed RNA polymerase specialized sigma24 family protein
MLATFPQLRAFAFSLSRNIDRADDLVQEGCCARHPELLKWPIDHAGVLTFDLATDGRE